MKFHRPRCPAFAPDNDHFVAICKNAQCTKVNSLLVVPSESVDQSTNDNAQAQSRSSNDSSASAALVFLWALVIALLLVTV